MAGEIRTAEDIEAELASLEQEEHSRLADAPNDDDEAAAAAEAAKLDGKAAGIDYDTEAGRKGWVPKDKYKGDPAKWVDSKTFVERGERFNANLQREVQELRATLESFKGTAKAFADFSQKQLAQKDTELKEAISALRIQRAEALRDGDAALSVEIEDRIDLLKDEQKAAKEVVAEVKEERVPGPQQDDPVLLEWIEDGNQWFTNNPKLRDYAVRAGEALIKGGETVKGRRFLDKISEMMRTEFPRSFKKMQEDSESGNTGRTNTVESASNGSAPAKRYNGKSERDLPAEDLALMKEYIKEGWTTKEKFLTSYFSRNG